MPVLVFGTAPGGKRLTHREAVHYRLLRTQGFKVWQDVVCAVDATTLQTGSISASCRYVDNTGAIISPLHDSLLTNLEESRPRWKT